MFVGHRPDDAELIAEVVPQPAVAMALHDPALETGRGLGGNVAGVDVEPLQHGLRRLGKLLNGVHDRNLLGNPQMF